MTHSKCCAKIKFNRKKKFILSLACTRKRPSNHVYTQHSRLTHGQVLATLTMQQILPCDSLTEMMFHNRKAHVQSDFNLIQYKQLTRLA